MRSSKDATECDEKGDCDTEWPEERKPFSQHRRDGKTRRTMSRRKGIQSRCPGKGHVPVSRVDEFRSGPADKVFHPVGEQGSDSVSDQRLDGDYFDSRFFKSPRADD